MEELQFAKEYTTFMQEMDEHYKTYPVDVSRQEKILENKLSLNPQASAMEKKTWV